MSSNESTLQSSERPVRPIRLGTRASQLALVQANWVAEQLRASGAQVEIVHITTTGDQSTAPLTQGGGIGLFTNAIQRALLEDRIDVAVHSLKDLPTDVVPGLSVAAVPPRERMNDVLISADGRELKELSRGARVGTGSMRRRAQLLAIRSDLQVVDMRGNVDTRLQKLEDGEFDAIVLAAAGLRRLGRIDQRCWEIPRLFMLPAVGQGALGIETRTDDTITNEQIMQLNDTKAFAAVTAERAMLRELTAGCLAPVGTWSQTGGDLTLAAAVFSADGTEVIEAERVGSLDAAADLGIQVARLLLDLGASRLIEAARG